MVRLHGNELQSVGVLNRSVSHNFSRPFMEILGYQPEARSAPAALKKEITSENDSSQ